MEKLGRLESVEVRSVWSDEYRDFTPWLFENGEVLSEALGLDVELTAREHPVGGYSLDLYGRDLTNDCVLIVENQLEQSDHTHLGQVLTYAGGTDASTIIWVAPRFRQEHLAAVDWINDRTDEDTRLFAVEIGVRRIGDSQPAPFLDVVGNPNDWHKEVRASTRSAVSDTGATYSSFWEGYVDEVGERHPEWRTQDPTSRNYNNHFVPIRGSVLAPTFADRKRVGVRLWIGTGDHGVNREVFELLHDHQGDFEDVLSGEMVWDNREERRACDIGVYISGSIRDEDRFDEFRDWFISTEETFRSVLSNIDIPEHLTR